MRTLQQLHARQVEIDGDLKRLSEVRDLSGSAIGVQEDRRRQLIAEFDELEYALYLIRRLNSPQVLVVTMKQRERLLRDSIWTPDAWDALPEVVAAAQAWAWILSEGPPPILVRPQFDRPLQGIKFA